MYKQLEFPLEYSAYPIGDRTFVYKGHIIWLDHPWTKGSRPFISFRSSDPADVIVDGEKIFSIPPNEELRICFAHYVGGILDHFYVLDYVAFESAGVADKHATSCPFCRKD